MLKMAVGLLLVGLDLASLPLICTHHPIHLAALIGSVWMGKNGFLLIPPSAFLGTKKIKQFPLLFIFTGTILGAEGQDECQVAAAKVPTFPKIDLNKVIPGRRLVSAFTRLSSFLQTNSFITQTTPLSDP
jgi:hypothetical protein